jgi:addiction module HigA family antidote
MIKLPNIHPGDVLREDFLVPLGMTAYRLAQGIGMQQTAVSEILNGKRSITPATALRLGRFFGIEPEFWLNLQATYDLEEERDRMADRLAAIEPCDLDEQHRQRMRELEERRRQMAAPLDAERESAAEQLAAIQPCDVASV